MGIHPISTMPLTVERTSLEVFNILKNPLWIFDISSKSMFWGNHAALNLWSAESLESLVSRDFRSDMSDATEIQLNDYLKRFDEKGEVIHDKWTFYPNFGKEGPKTVRCAISGVRIKDAGLMMLVEAVYVTDDQSVQGMDVHMVETLRHLPVAIRQFDMQGKLLNQNPEALGLFGHMEQQKSSEEECLCDFVDMFQDRELGKKAWEQAHNLALKGDDYQLEAEQRCLPSSGDPVKWFSIKLRKSKDRLNNQDMIIYSGRDVSDIMIRAKEEAYKINREKSEFFAVMAHEIRTPLHQVNGFIELLSHTALNEEQNDFVSLLQNSTSALMAIINDLLDITKLEAGKLELECIPFEPRSVLNACIAASLKQAEDKGLVLSCDAAQKIPVKLMGDPNRLRQIVSNMVSNAVKFTKEGKVTVIARRLQDDVSGNVVLRVEVRDTGIGIADVNAKGIFNPYQQADASVSRNFGGTGLGLAICDSLVKIMGGDIGVESELGKGTTFWFEVPYQPYQKKMDPAVQTTTAVGEDLSATTTRPLRILIAEDNKVNQKVATSMIKRLGHSAMVVENGQMAVDEIVSNRDAYDIVLMDIQMPVLDGIDAAKEIRNRGFLESDLPIVALTASIQSVDWKQVGMNDCIRKPVRINDLKKALSKNTSTKTENSPEQPEAGQQHVHKIQIAA